MTQTLSVNIKAKILNIKELIETSTQGSSNTSETTDSQTSLANGNDICAELDELYEMGCQVADFIEAINRANILIQD